MEDFADALYTASVGVTAMMAEHLQLSVDLISSFKNRSPTPGIKKNDTTVVTALVVKY